MTGRICNPRAIRAAFATSCEDATYESCDAGFLTPSAVSADTPATVCGTRPIALRAREEPESRPWVATEPSRIALSGAGSRPFTTRSRRADTPTPARSAELLSVSSKTVQRDIDYLRDELDAPIEFHRDENGYAYSRDDYVLPFLPVDGQDLFSIGVAAQVLALLGGTPLSKTLRSCYERLARLMPPAVRLRPEVVREQLTLRATRLSARARGDVAGGLGRAAEGHRALDPLPPSGRGARRAARDPSLRVRPRRARLDGPRRGLVAGTDQELLSRAHRRGEADRRALRDPAELRRRPSSSATRSGCSWAEAGRSASACVSRPRSRTRSARWSGIPISKIETAADGEAILELPAESIREARRFILAYGRHAAALSPPELVRDLREEADGLAALYASGAAADARDPGKRKKSARRARS